MERDDCGTDPDALRSTRCLTVDAQGSPAQREILYNDIYNWDNEPSTNTLEVHIHNFGATKSASRIRTVRGFTYMLVTSMKGVSLDAFFSEER